MAGAGQGKCRDRCKESDGFHPFTDDSDTLNISPYLFDIQAG